MVATPSRIRTLASPDRGGYEEYHPYGSTAWWAGSSATISQKRYRYTGMERDEETGLQCHGVRYYAPWLGRWVSADPIGVSAGLNRYSYAGNSPIGLLDPGGCAEGPGLQVPGIGTLEEGVATSLTSPLPPRSSDGVPELQQSGALGTAAGDVVPNVSPQLAAVMRALVHRSRLESEQVVQGEPGRPPTETAPGSLGEKSQWSYETGGFYYILPDGSEGVVWAGGAWAEGRGAIDLTAALGAVPADALFVLAIHTHPGLETGPTFSREDIASLGQYERASGLMVLGSVDPELDLSDTPYAMLVKNARDTGMSNLQISGSLIPGYTLVPSVYPDLSLRLSGSRSAGELAAAADPRGDTRFSNGRPVLPVSVYYGDLSLPTLSRVKPRRVGE